MKILMPIDISGIISGNPFCTELIHSLEACGCSVDHGRFWLNRSNIDWDVVHFHWPEYLLAPHKLEFDNKWLENCLRNIKQRNSKIICTVHNLQPHKDKSRETVKTYKLLYSYADGFIHFGAESITLVKQRFPNEVNGKPYTIIPHGNYKVFGPLINKAKARTSLSIANKPTFLIIGALRNSLEYQISQRAAKYISRLGGQLLFCGTDSLPRTPITTLRSYKKRLFEEVSHAIQNRRIKYANSTIKVPGPVPSSLVSTILSAADTVIIPRIDTLNSGNIPLAFSYGCVAVGPNVGNIGECLKATGNPTFSYEWAEESLDIAIKKSLIALEKNVGSANYRYSQQILDWEKIGIQHRGFYERVCKQ